MVFTCAFGIAVIDILRLPGSRRMSVTAIPNGLSRPVNASRGRKRYNNYYSETASLVHDSGAA